MAKNSNSGQKFISRNRKPRVHITYEDPYDSEELVELPFVMGVMADLSGNASAVEKPEMEDRKFLDTDMDNFDARMAAIEPGRALQGRPTSSAARRSTKLSVNLKFKQDGGFRAGRDRPPGAGDGQAARRRASSSAICLRYMDGKVAAEDTLKKLLADPQLMAALKQKLEQRPAAEDDSRNKERLSMASPQQEARPSPSRRNGAGRSRRHSPPSSSRSFKPRSEQAATRSRKRGADAGHPGARRFQPRQGRRHRHDRGDDRAARREALRADERGPARPGVPATGKRLARPALSRVQLRDRRDLEDQGDERRQDRALPPLQAVPRRALGPEPAVQEDLRAGVRHARRRALWRAGRRLSLQPFADRRVADARSLEDRLRRAGAARHRRRSEPARHGYLDAN